LKNKIPLFVLTIKNSKREYLIKKRLNFLKINYKIFYAIDARNPKNFKILKKKYDQKKCLSELGKDMSYAQISNSEGHLRIYKYIMKKNILNAVVIEDDCYPSKLLFDWLKLNSFFNNRKYDIIQIYHSHGFVYKKPVELITKKFSLHKACCVLPYATCYQITQKVCKYILSRNKLISRFSDWPINFHNSKIKQYAVLPYIASLHFNHINTSYQNNLWRKFIRVEEIKKFIPFYNLMTAFYFLSHVPFFIKRYKNYSYYKEKYLLKKIFYIKNLFFNCYINLENTIKNKKFYPNDLIKNGIKSSLF
jgi:hypothetical protein